MLAKVQKWGNSLALRIPRPVAQEAGVDLDSQVDLAVRGHQIVITPARGRYTLEELCSQITPENRHDLVDWGSPEGKEIW